MPKDRPGNALAQPGRHGHGSKYLGEPGNLTEQPGELVDGRFVRILTKLLHSKAAHIGVRIFLAVIPTHSNARFRRAAHQSDRLSDDIQLFVGIAGNAYFGFQTKLHRHCVHAASLTRT